MIPDLKILVKKNIGLQSVGLLFPESGVLLMEALIEPKALSDQLISDGVTAKLLSPSAQAHLKALSAAITQGVHAFNPENVKTYSLFMWAPALAREMKREEVLGKKGSDRHYHTILEEQQKLSFSHDSGWDEFLKFQFDFITDLNSHQLNRTERRSSDDW